MNFKPILIFSFSGIVICIALLFCLSPLLDFLDKLGTHRTSSKPNQVLEIYQQWKNLPQSTQIQIKKEINALFK